MAFLETLSIRLGRWLAWGFLVIALMMVFEVVARYGFNRPTFWAHEIATFLAAVAFVFGGAFCMAEGSHMRIDLLLQGDRPRLRRLSDFVGLCAGVVYLGGMAWAAWQMSGRSFFRFSADGAWNPERSGSTWNTPLPGMIKFALFVGSVLFLLVVLRRLALLFTRRA